jgi:ribulose bisphosphate carboxylase small subunit
MTNQITPEMLADYASFIKQDFINWWTQNGTYELTKTQQNMVDDLQIEFERGSSYIRVVQSTPTGQRSSHSFIVQKAGQFPVGTILKSASWKAPAKNFARGSVMTGDFKRVSWTGAI